MSLNVKHEFGTYAWIKGNTNTVGKIMRDVNFAMKFDNNKTGGTIQT
jgi:hypothetical protein